MSEGKGVKIFICGSVIVAGIYLAAWGGSHGEWWGFPTFLVCGIGVVIATVVAITALDRSS
jgi:fatty acid desaturase